MKNLNNYIDKLFKDNMLSNIALRIGSKDKIIYELYRSKEGIINSETLFDMASVTKIMVTASLFMIGKDMGLLSYNDKVSKYFNCEKDKDLRLIDILTHQSGIPYRDLSKEKENNDIVNLILNLKREFEVGKDVYYSCPGYILLGKILEKIFDDNLDNLFNKYVKEKLNLNLSCYNPDRTNKNIVNSNIKAEERGIVNDINGRFLKGVAGNVGLFSNIDDLTKFAHMILNYGYPLISKETFKDGIENKTKGLSEAIGIGYFYADGIYPQTGKLFSIGSVGHCGHTGQSIFCDFKKDMYVIILSDLTLSTIKKYGEEKYEKVIKIREELHNEIKKDLF